MHTLQDLLAQRAALETEISKAQATKRASVIATVKSMMAEYGLTITDIAGKGHQSIRTQRLPVAAKYRNEKTGETWSGRGLQPKWLKAALASGATVEQFKV